MVEGLLSVPQGRPWGRASHSQAHYSPTKYPWQPVSSSQWPEVFSCIQMLCLSSPGGLGASQNQRPPSLASPRGGDLSLLWPTVTPSGMDCQVFRCLASVHLNHLQYVCNFPSQTKRPFPTNPSAPPIPNDMPPASPAFSHPGRHLHAASWPGLHFSCHDIIHPQTHLQSRLAQSRCSMNQ